MPKSTRFGGGTAARLERSVLKWLTEKTAKKAMYRGIRWAVGRALGKKWVESDGPAPNGPRRASPAEAVSGLANTYGEEILAESSVAIMMEIHRNNVSELPAEPWLCRTVSNSAANVLRKTSREWSRRLISPVGELEDLAAVTDIEATTDVRRKVREIYARLTEDELELLIQADGYGSTTALAQQRGISKKTLNKRIERTRGRLATVTTRKD